MFDVGFDPTKSVWTPWMSSSFEYKIPPTTKFNNIVIPTVDTIRNEFLMDQLLLNGFHVLCTGDTVMLSKLLILYSLVSLFYICDHTAICRYSALFYTCIGFILTQATIYIYIYISNAYIGYWKVCVCEEEVVRRHA